MIQNDGLEIRETQHYQDWFTALRDIQAQARINLRIRRLVLGYFGDIKAIESGVFELRIHCGPGYRVYFCKRSERIVILLAGGNKSSQARDIKQAVALAKRLKE
jgi:putative addiction module killer protein